MNTYEVVSKKLSWRVWITNPCVFVSTEREAREFLLAQGYDFYDEVYLGSYAVAVHEVTMDWPLEVGQSFHELIWLPGQLILYDGNIQVTMHNGRPDILSTCSTEWQELYHRGLNNPDILVFDGPVDLKAKLNDRWPKQPEALKTP